MKFAEDLPASCPPLSAVDEPIDNVFRLIKAEVAENSDFASKALLGENMPSGLDACGWASCSLFGSVTPLLKYKRLRMEKPFVACLNIPQGHGRHVANDRSGHLDFWAYDGKYLTACVISVEGVGNG